MTASFAEAPEPEAAVTAHTYPQEVTARFVRLRGLERATPYGYSLPSTGRRLRRRLRAPGLRRQPHPVRLVENIGYADWTSTALHGPGYPADGRVGARQVYPSGGRADQWHTYAVEWTPTPMRFLFDDRPVQETTRNTLESARGECVFDHDQ